MNDWCFILILMILMEKATIPNGNRVVNFIGCFMPSLFLYSIPKVIVLAMWYRGHLTWPIQGDPPAHWVSGSISFVLVASLLVHCIRKRNRHAEST